jgi:hypothetical protein
MYKIRTGLFVPEAELEDLDRDPLVARNVEPKVPEYQRA